jgi:hypothetical protein
MLTVALIVFAVAAIGGLVLALHVLRGKFAPWPLSLLHAGLGATGLILLLLAVLRGFAGSLGAWALGLFVVAALGGFYLASLHRRQVPAPKGVVVLHALLAVSGFGLLLAMVLG